MSERKDTETGNIASTCRMKEDRRPETEKCQRRHPEKSVLNHEKHEILEKGNIAE